MKTSFLHFSGAAALVLATAMTASIAHAQAPAAAPQGHAEEHHHDMPAPTNLQVLPKNLTAEQVHQIMHKWEAALGTNCSTCHAVDPKRVGPNGRPMLNFADDSKPEKRTARLMYKMTEKINVDYISMVENSGVPVTCGTCHRGHVSPEPFIPPPDHDHDEHHGAAPAQQPK